MEKSPFLKFERPLAVYAELYNQEVSDRQEVSASPSLAASLVAAFFVIVCASFFLRGVEYYLQPPFRMISLPSAPTSEEQTIILPNFFRLPSLEIPASVTEYLAETGRRILAVENVQAAELDYAAQKYSKIEELEMVAGERKQIKIGFDNKGRYNWRRDGSNFISIYTDQPRYHSSVFWDKSWFQKDQPAKLKDSIVGPGQRGYFEFYLQAPKKPGVYKEHFALAAENKAWLAGGQFELIITVKPAESNQSETVGQAVPAPLPELARPEPLPQKKLKQLNSSDFQARQLSRLEPMSLKGGETGEFRVMFLNQGKKAWTERKLVLSEVRLGLVKAAAPLAGANWLDSETVLELKDAPVKIGQTEIYAVSLQAPATDERRVYNLYFNLLVNQQLIKGGAMAVPLVVNGSAAKGMMDPSIRVGLYTTEDPIIFSSPFSYQIKTSEGEELGLINPYQEIKISLAEDTGLYTIEGLGDPLTTNPWALILEPVESGSYFELVNYENRPRWNKNLNDNQFRGALKLIFNRASGYLWVINELPLESYLKGLAEVAENSPAELQKAVAVAARSFALAQMKDGSKHAANSFDLDAAVDQVYRGYGQEKRSPKLAAAVEAASGLIMTYKGEIISTPYFSRSNGRTRTWKEVWGGTDKPWLKSVKAPYDKGYSRLGHGVGMSLHDATHRAQKDALYEDILKYYYTGVEIQKVY